MKFVCQLGEMSLIFFFFFQNHMENIHSPEIFGILLLVPFLQDNVLPA